MKSSLFVAASLLATVAAPVLAQDADTAVSTRKAFTGPRAEFFGAWTKNHSVIDNTAATPVRSKDNRDMLTVGALGGYDLPIGEKIVAGVFGSYALSTGRRCTDTRTRTLGSGCFKAGRDIEGGARIGYKLLGGKALGYVKGAYVNTSARSRLYKPDGSFGYHDNFGGWRAGAGIEYALNQHFYTKVEYNYTDFGTFSTWKKPYTALRIPNTDIALDRNQVQAGFGVRF